MITSKGTDVFSKDGIKIGTIDRVVVDPQSKEVTHFIVGEGRFFASEYVVSTDDIEFTAEGEIVLQKMEEELEDNLPVFEEAHFVELSEGEQPFEEVDALYWYPPVGGWWNTGNILGYDMPQYVINTDRNIPDDKVPLQKRARVVTDAGEQVGRIKRVVVERDRITHIVIMEGILFREEQIIPSQWIREIQESEVILSVGKETLEGIFGQVERTMNT